MHPYIRTFAACSAGLGSLKNGSMAMAIRASPSLMRSTESGVFSILGKPATMTAAIENLPVYRARFGCETRLQIRS